jgi:F-type H+-transporting ATPase subunit epsilon
MAKQFHVDIVSPEGLVWSGEAEFVVARTPEGEIGILADHEPVMAALTQGLVSVDSTEGRTNVDVEGGFLQVLANQVTLITDRARIGD